MQVGITESKTHEFLLQEMGKLGLVGSDGLVLFGGTPSPCRPTVWIDTDGSQRTRLYPTERVPAES